MNQPLHVVPIDALTDLEAEIARADKFLTHSPSGDLDGRFVVAPEGGGRAVCEHVTYPGRYSVIPFRVFGRWTAFEWTEAVLCRSALNSGLAPDAPRFAIYSVREALENHREACTKARALLAPGAGALPLTMGGA
jgi:hypothetical protein